MVTKTQPFFVATARKAAPYLQEEPFGGRENMEHEVRNGRLPDQAGFSRPDRNSPNGGDY